jgi:hypothetical protein
MQQEQVQRGLADEAEQPGDTDSEAGE